MHPGLRRDVFDAIVDAADAADIPFAGHVSTDVGLLHTLEQGQVTIDHLDGFMPLLVDDSIELPDGAADFFGLGLGPAFDRDRLPDVVAATKASGAWVVPTETPMENMADARTDLAALLERDETAYLPPGLLANYRGRLEQAAAPFEADAFLAARKALIAALHRGGVPVLLGSDAPQIMNVPGFSLHRELEAMVAAGTTSPAAFFQAAGAFGVIAPGAEASFVLLRRNPIVDIARTREIEGVMVRGRWLDRAFLDAGLADIRARYAAD